MILAIIKQPYVILNLDADCSFYCPKLISKNKIFKDMSDQQHGSVPLWRTVIEDVPEIVQLVSTRPQEGQKSSNYTYILHHMHKLKQMFATFQKEMFKKL